MSGFPPEMAITEPPSGRKNKPFWDLERRDLVEIRTERVKLPSLPPEPSSDWERIQLGFEKSLEDSELSREQTSPAVASSIRKIPGLYKAFDQWKTLLDWSKDPGCPLTYRKLKQAIDAGQELEGLLLGD